MYKKRGEKNFLPDLAAERNDLLPLNGHFLVVTQKKKKSQMLK